MAALLGVGPVFGASYSTDKTYQFPGQSWTNSGRGIAVNSADTRLYAVKRSSSTGAVYILDTATGSEVGSITPPAPTTLYDVALSPDDSTVYFARATGSDWEIDAAPASDGVHGPADVTTVIPSLSAAPQSIAVGQSGSDVYLAMVTDTFLWIYQRGAGGSWSRVGDVNIGFRTATRDVAAVQTPSGLAFHVLTSSFTSGSDRSPDVRVFNPDGTERAITFGSLPAGFENYSFNSITYGGAVDGVPSVFIAADTVDGSFNARLAVFRFTSEGAYANDGFGYGLSSTEPLSMLAPLGTDTILVPGAVANSHFYLGAILPGDEEETVRVVIESGTAQPGSISGQVKTPDGQPAEGAHVVVEGRGTTVTTGADGSFTLGSLAPGTYQVGAWKFGYVAASAPVTVASGAETQGVVLTLPGTVPTYTLGRSFLPPITDGEVFPAEYPSSPMPFYQLGGAAPAPSVTTTAYASYDEDWIYVAVVGREPSLHLNRSVYDNQNMLLSDDTVQIYLDPPHRHNVPAESPSLYQFVVNIPALVAGQPLGSSSRIQRRIDADGAVVAFLPPTAWTSSVGYTSSGWIVEARISMGVLGILTPPGPGSEWGLLVARHRPEAHQDALPTNYTTSPAQQGAFAFPNTWSDIGFGEQVPGAVGDVNRNGAVDWADVVYVLRMTGGLSFGSTAPGQPDQNQAYRESILQAADVWPKGAPDGRITIEDAIRTARAAAGTDTLP